MTELRIIYWNIAGLRGRLHFLKLLLKEQKVDVALICEALMLATDKVNLPGYHTLQLSSSPDTPRRGLLVAIRRNLVHQPLPLLDTRTFQSLGVEVHHGDRRLCIFAIYRPPTSTLTTAKVREVLNSSTPTLAAGDWNAKHPSWRCRVACTTGRR